MGNGMYNGGENGDLIRLHDDRVVVDHFVQPFLIINTGLWTNDTVFTAIIKDWADAARNFA